MALSYSATPMTASFSSPLAELPAVAEDSAMAQHKINEDIDLQSIYRRSDTVQKLADLIDEEKVVLVLGAPKSGKTTLALLLQSYYASQKKNVIYTNAWEDIDKYRPQIGDLGALEQMLHRRSAIPAKGIASGAIIIVDDSHTSYPDFFFWNSIIKPLLSGLFYRQVRFCLFSSYGNPSTGVEQVIGSYHPVTFGSQRRVSLTIQPKGPPFALFFTEPEFHSVIDKIIANNHPLSNITLDNDAKDYLFSLTNGHPGGTKSLVDLISFQCRGSIKHGETIITKDQILGSMKIEEKEKDVWDYLERTPVYQSFPKANQLSLEARAILAHVLETGNRLWYESYLPCEDNEELDRCYQEGWLYLTEDGFFGNHLYVLPSRLHEKWVESLINQEKKHFPSKFPSLQDLVMTILREFSPTLLDMSSRGRKLSSAASYRPVEAQYQDEFYRVFNQVVGRGVPISSEWSRTGHGRVDFWIKEKQWAIKFLKDHDRVDEYIVRVSQNGKHYDWVKDDMAKDWIIVNCATSMPHKVYPEPRLIHAVFNPDYKGVRILDNGLNELGYHVLTN
ncbi:hypothetical protein BJX63DRAFT_203552 [Aspergillus granulosus]|uniref:Novel STAND NTPase 3 domain-containing protein n=1 Tax=Aspergillus granulosus TaxID=176169 RepID=A0ABR4HGN5_9EURO